MKKNATTDELFEVSLSVAVRRPGALELLKSVFVSAGFNLYDLIERSEDGQESVCVYVTSLEKIAEVEEKFKTLKLRGVRLNRQRLFRKDWQEQWKKDFYPFALTTRLDVVPVWHAKAYRRRKRIPIYIDTTMAFGTGLHETTKFMARLIESCRGKFATFTDIGTGSGILTLVASHSGAEKLCAIDIDPESVRTARQNLRKNGLAPRLVWCADLNAFKAAVPFDFVAANLVTDELIRRKRKIFSFVAPGKYLAISGISIPNLPRIQKAFGTLPLRCLRVMKGKKWTALLYKRV